MLYHAVGPVVHSGPYGPLGTRNAFARPSEESDDSSKEESRGSPCVSVSCPIPAYPGRPRFAPRHFDSQESTLIR